MRKKSAGRGRANQDYEVQDQGNLRRYRTEIPNMVDDMEKLSVYAFRLYVRLKRVAGDTGACWESTRTLADRCNMSIAKVSDAKKELVEAGLITIERRDNNQTDMITLIDIWPQNFEKYAPPKPEPQPQPEVKPESNTATELLAKLVAALQSEPQGNEINDIVRSLLPQNAPQQSIEDADKTCSQDEQGCSQEEHSVRDKNTVFATKTQCSQDEQGCSPQKHSVRHSATKKNQLRRTNEEVTNDQEPMIKSSSSSSVNSTGIASQNGEEDEDLKSVRAAWKKHYGSEIPDNILPPLTKLLEERGRDAVIHGIESSASAQARSFSYIAKCAANYVPPAPEQKADYGGWGELVSNRPTVPNAEPPQPEPQQEPEPPTEEPTSHLDELWSIVKKEALSGLPLYAADWLNGSRLVETGEVSKSAGKDVPHYKLAISPQYANGIDWLRSKIWGIRRRIEIAMMQSIMLEITIAEEREVEPA